MPYVVSTLSSDQRYVGYHQPPANGAKIARPATPQQDVLIKGGANVAGRISTPDGMITAVTDDQLTFLQTVKSFQQHIKMGHLKIMNREAVVEKAVRDMSPRDESAPLSEEKGDFKIGGRAAGVAPKTFKAD